MSRLISDKQWITTLTSRFFPTSTWMDFKGKQEEIAEALAKQPRYMGHTPGVFYSVAEHSVLVSNLAASMASPGLKTECAKTGLMHDGSEAYMGDMPTPIKRLLTCYLGIEDGVQKDVYKAFKCLTSDYISQIVRSADKLSLEYEAHIRPEHTWRQLNMDQPRPSLEPDWRVHGLEWRAAKDIFLARFEEIF